MQLLQTVGKKMLKLGYFQDISKNQHIIWKYDELYAYMYEDIL